MRPARRPGSRRACTDVLDDAELYRTRYVRPAERLREDDGTWPVSAATPQRMERRWRASFGLASGRHVLGPSRSYDLDHLSDNEEEIAATAAAGVGRLTEIARSRILGRKGEGSLGQALQAAGAAG